MPARLRPTTPIAAEAILVGDPGRALALAQVLLEKPKMSNHARGLWGYTGITHAGDELTLQATGIGGPSAALVLTDLAELGVRRAIRVGTATGLSGTELGELILVGSARVWREGDAGTPVVPDPALTESLGAALGVGARAGEVASLDHLHSPGEERAPLVDAADMQTAALLAAGPRLGIAVAAVLVVTETAAGDLDDEALAAAAERGGSAAVTALRASQNPTLTLHSRVS